MAQIILHETKWIRAYTSYREFGAASLFGEKCTVDRTSQQAELLSLNQLYDVFYQQPDVMESVPDALWPYPTKMSKWYDEFNKKRNKNMKGKKRDDDLSMNVENDERADMLAYAKALQTQPKPGTVKNTDWAKRIDEKRNKQR